MSEKAKQNIGEIIDIIITNYTPLPPTLVKGILNYEYPSHNNLLQKLDIFVRKHKPNINQTTKGGIIKMADEEKHEQEYVFDLQRMRPTDFRKQLSEYQDLPVTVEFCCGEFCKQASGCLVLIGCDFIELVGFNGEPLIIEVICCEGTFEPELPAFRITIPLERVASVELLTPPKRPCPPPYDPPRRPYEKDEE